MVKQLKKLLLFIFCYNTKQYIIKYIFYIDLLYTEYKVYCIYRILGIKIPIYIKKRNSINGVYDIILNNEGVIKEMKNECK